MFKRFTASVALLLALALLTTPGAVARQGAAAIKPPDATATLNATDDVLKTVSRMQGKLQPERTTNQRILAIRSHHDLLAQEQEARARRDAPGSCPVAPYPRVHDGCRMVR